VSKVGDLKKEKERRNTKKKFKQIQKEIDFITSDKFRRSFTKLVNENGQRYVVRVFPDD